MLSICRNACCHTGCRLATLLLVFKRGANERREEWVWLERLRVEFRVELAAEEPRMFRRFDDFDVIFIGRATRNLQSRSDQRLLVFAVEFVAMAMPLADFERSVSFVRKGSRFQLAWPCA